MKQVDEGYLEFRAALEMALTSTERALEAILRPSGPKRSIWYRMLLLRAQNVLKRLVELEQARMGDADHLA